MAALVQFTTMPLIRNSRLMAQGDHLHKLAAYNNNRASLRISCSNKPTTPAMSDRETATLGNGISKQADAFTPGKSRPGAATKTGEDRLEFELQADMESELDVYCDILPHSRECQEVQRSSPSSRPTKEVPSEEIEMAGSKKPLRLSSVTSDLLD